MELRFLQFDTAALETPRASPKSLSLDIDNAVFKRSNMSLDEKVFILCIFFASKFGSKQNVY